MFYISSVILMDKAAGSAGVGCSSPVVGGKNSLRIETAGLWMHRIAGWWYLVMAHSDTLTLLRYCSSVD
jgi:hypothetical protein